MMLAAISEVLGTTWWSILCLGVGFVLGVFLSNKVKAIINR